MMLLVNCVYQLISDYKYLSIFIKSAGLSEYGKPVWPAIKLLKNLNVMQ